MAAKPCDDMPHDYNRGSDEHSILPVYCLGHLVVFCDRQRYEAEIDKKGSRHVGMRRLDPGLSDEEHEKD